MGGGAKEEDAIKGSRKSQTWVSLSDPAETCLPDNHLKALVQVPQEPVLLKANSRWISCFIQCSFGMQKYATAAPAVKRKRESRTADEDIYNFPVFASLFVLCFHFRSSQTAAPNSLANSLLEILKFAFPASLVGLYGELYLPCE